MDKFVDSIRSVLIRNVRERLLQSFRQDPSTLRELRSLIQREQPVDDADIVTITDSVKRWAVDSAVQMMLYELDQLSTQGLLKVSYRPTESDEWEEINGNLPLYGLYIDWAEQADGKTED